MRRKRSFSKILVLGVALGICTLAAPRGALGQTAASETARVTELFKSGKAAFSKGDMPEAERLFAEALALRKSSDIAANLAQSQLEQHKYRKAAEHFSWALSNLLPSATDAQRKAVETGLSRSRAEVAVLRLEIKPDGSDVLVGSDSVAKSPVPHSVFVDPGEVIISVKHDGFVSVDKRVVVGKGTEQAIEISLTPKENAAPVAQPPLVDSGLRTSGPALDHDSKPKSLVPAFVATGVAVAGGVVGLVFTLNANSKSKDASALRDRVLPLGGCGNEAAAPDGRVEELSQYCTALKSELESKDSATNIAVGAFVVGGVAALAAGYFYWDALRHRGADTSMQRRRTIGASLAPSLDIGRSRANGATVESIKLSLSGNF